MKSTVALRAKHTAAEENATFINFTPHEQHKKTHCKHKSYLNTEDKNYINLMSTKKKNTKLQQRKKTPN